MKRFKVSKENFASVRIPQSAKVGVARGGGGGDGSTVVTGPWEKVSFLLENQTSEVE